MKFLDKFLVTLAVIILTAITLWVLASWILHSVLGIVIPLFILTLVIYLLKKLLW